MDKNQAIIDYLLACPQLANSPLYFNYGEGADGNKEIVTVSNDVNTHQPYIDGSVSKRYTFTIIDFRSMTSNPIPKVTGYSGENVVDILDVQGIIDWVTQQNDLRNFPNFGDNCLIDEIKALSDIPNLNGIDTSAKPILAKYSISIQIDYIDLSRVIYNKEVQ